MRPNRIPGFLLLNLSDKPGTQTQTLAKYSIVKTATEETSNQRSDD
jgi:hypothetical protein